MGEFFNEGGEDDDLQIKLMGVEDGEWNIALIVALKVEGIEIRPTIG